MARSPTPLESLGIHRSLHQNRARAKVARRFTQIDTLFVNVRPDSAVKHSTAYDPVAKSMIGRVATSASAGSAEALLDKLFAKAPFPVDCGSEFKAGFEKA